LNVTITDHGPGIPDDALELVFAPFRRLEPSRNRNTGGMGLGLTAARACFRAHGGDVILSNARDGGLRAIVTLPLLSVDENESMRRGVPMFDDDPSDPIMLPSHAAGDRP
jgi:signal transduction histidine kinase